MVILSVRLMRDFKWAPTRIFLHISLWLAPSATFKVWGVHEKQGSLESVIQISLLTYLFFSPLEICRLGQKCGSTQEMSSFAIQEPLSQLYACNSAIALADPGSAECTHIT